MQQNADFWADLTHENHPKAPGHSCAHQVQAFDHEEEGVSLRSILESEVVTKLTCDCRMDSDALYHQFGVACRNVLDLQIAEVAFRRCGPATACIC
jgi:ribonuclease D